MNTPELVKTDDGSDTLFVQEPGEHYHSTFGAVQESMHVFIEAGLRKCDQPSLNLLEVGFGTGLNAYLTVLEAHKVNIAILYITVEKYPLPPSVWTLLNYPEIVSEGNPKLFRMIHEAKWNEEVKITYNFSILKLSSDLKNIDYSALPLFDLIYFDAFSPVKQPELWETSIFQQLANHCATKAKLVTYCAKGAVRRSLKEAGFTPERIPGPPGKREMLRGTKNEPFPII
ncbi:MAG: tRNA (5-methylaminomethyl-2-thiouridine)(34)-methyltransferase MnmD [Bacteroidia bacterium]|nr:tRNA (5-methylaminomethyl-2-thiouridine)(34)-methyltransferase MnmD [Bacteroidia bacterium]